jgi:Fibronectin-attachment protein (FAP)
MTQPDSISRRAGLWTAFAITAVTAATAVTIALPTSAVADPATPTPTPVAPAAPPPADPNAPPVYPPPPADPNAPPVVPPPPVDPNAPPVVPPPPADPNAPPVDPNAPLPPAPLEPGRVPNATGGFSYLLPAGWVVSDASRLNYGQALLSKTTAPAENGQPAPTASDTSVILGRLDLKLFAGAEQDNSKAAIRLASDMGEFFMPFPGVRLNQQSGALQAGDMPGYFSSYEVKFTDTTKPNGQIWAGVVGSAAPNAPRDQRNQRWFVVWLGTGKDPIDPAAAKALAESIRPYAPPPAPVGDPNAPVADPNAPPPVAGGRLPLGVPVPVEGPVPGMTPGQ